MHPAFSVSAELQNKIPLVTSMGNMPDITGNEVPVRSWHNGNNFNLKICFYR
jgi:hypothetical protein